MTDSMCEGLETMKDASDQVEVLKRELHRVTKEALEDHRLFRQEREMYLKQLRSPPLVAPAPLPWLTSGKTAALDKIQMNKKIESLERANMELARELQFISMTHPGIVDNHDIKFMGLTIDEVHMAVNNFKHMRGAG